jgi:hypothetical protein
MKYLRSSRRNFGNAPSAQTFLVKLLLFDVFGISHATRAAGLIVALQFPELALPNHSGAGSSPREQEEGSRGVQEARGSRLPKGLEPQLVRLPQVASLGSIK